MRPISSIHSLKNFEILIYDDEGQHEMGKLKQEFSQEDIYDILTSSKLHITNMFIYLLF